MRRVLLPLVLLAALVALMLPGALGGASPVGADPAFGNVAIGGGVTIQGHKFAIPINMTTCADAANSGCRLGSYSAEVTYDPFRISLDRSTGTSTGSNTTTTLADTTKLWRVDQWKGSRVTLTGGAGAYGANSLPQSRLVTANTATTLTVAAPWDADAPQPDATTAYLVGGITDAGFLSSTGRDIVCPPATNGFGFLSVSCATLGHESSGMPVAANGMGKIAQMTFTANVRGITSLSLVTPGTGVWSGNTTVIPADISSVANRRIILCPDPNLDNTINAVDLSQTAQKFALTTGQPGYTPQRDPDENGVINAIDLSLIAQVFGKKCVTPDPPEHTPTATVTPTATGTPTQSPTATPTPAQPEMRLYPEGNDANTLDAAPAANLWLCITPTTAPATQCSGPGEGNLVVYEYASGVHTGDMDANTVEDGLGAYEFSLDYDNFIISNITAADVVFSPESPLFPGGSDGVTDGAGIARTPANCSFSMIFPPPLRFGCVTAGFVAGPLGSWDLARLDLRAHQDLINDIKPNDGNEVVTSVLATNCELADIFGHPVTGSVNGGLTPVCGDLSVSVRILRGDIDLNCSVGFSDLRFVAARYGSVFGFLMYSTWGDLEPAIADFDIDSLDVRKVLDRHGSTCQLPLPAQPPIVPGG